MNANVQTQTKPRSWPALYQAISDFYRSGGEPAGLENLPSQAEQLAQAILAQAKQSPYSLLAQLQLSAEQAPFATLVAMRQACLLLVLSYQQQWPEKLRIQLLSTALLGLLAVAEPLNRLSAEQRSNSKLLHLAARYSLARFNDQLPAYSRHWLQQCHPKAANLPYWQQNPFSSALALSYQLASRLCLSANAGLLRKLQSLFWRQLDPYSQHHLSALASSGPTLWRCGQRLQSAGQCYLVLDQQDDCWLLLPLQSGRLQGPVQAVTELVEPEHQLQSRFSDWSWLEQIDRACAAELIPQLWPEQSAASPLNYADIEALCALPQSELLQQLEHNPTDTQLLLEAASQANRSQQAIGQLKHALLLLGSSQLAWLLAQSQCLQFAQQQRQPFHLWLLQLRRMLHLALRKTETNLPAAQTELLSWLLCLPLWQQGSLRYLPGLTPASCQHLQQLCRRQIWQSNEFLKRLQWLCHHYQLPTTLQKALLYFRLPDSAHAQPATVRLYSQQLHQAFTQCEQLMLQPAPPFQLTEQTDAALLALCYYPLPSMM